MASLSSLNFLLLLFVTTTFTLAAGETFQVDFHHRFSNKVQEWATLQGLPTTWDPEEAPGGSVEYYKELVRHDQALLTGHGRLLLGNNDVYSFSMGNETLSIPSLGHLHYTLVSVGTPNQTFMVALSTGSALFWLPCNCKQCADLSSPFYEDVKLTTYSPNESSTSKLVSCGSTECNLLSSSGGTCTGTKNCPYNINYVSRNSSSSGFLVEDALYFLKEDTTAGTVKVPIVFGCGEVQTGFLLDTAAPNGMMGLGIDNISVPTMLAQKGLISDSFSMCFGIDGSGRLNFGDKGSSDQSETQLVNDDLPFYKISIEGMVIGNTTSKTSFTARVTSGVSYTYLTDKIYKEFTTLFTEQVTDTPLSDSTLPFDYCYEWGAGQTEVYLPVVNFTTQGGSIFPALDPIIRIFSNTSQDPVGYCLGVLPSTDVNKIGQYFLSGLRIVFNREKMVLGWQEFDCYGTKSSTPLPSNKNSTTAPHTSTTTSPAVEAAAPPNPDTTPHLRKKSWAPDLYPATMLNTALGLLFMVFITFNSVYC